MKSVFHFSPDYLERCKSLTTDQIVQFLDNYRKVYAGISAVKSKSVGLKVSDYLLDVFRTRCALEGVEYQAQINKLMREWLMEGA